MADRRPANQKPVGSGNPNRINRLLYKGFVDKFGKADNLVLIANINLNSEQTQELRFNLREKKANFRMVRNRLTVKALNQLGVKNATTIFQGATFVLEAGDPVATAKTALEITEKYNKSLKIIGGILEGNPLNANEVKELSKSKSKPEVLSEIVGITRGPGSRIAGALKGPGGRIAGAIKALIEKLEKQEAASAAPAAAEPVAAEAVAAEPAQA